MCRKLEVQHNRRLVPLSAIRRTLFATESPEIVQITTPKSCSRIHLRQTETPKSFYRNGATTPQFYLTPASGSYEFYDQISTPHSDILDETFTVISILKEIHMQKYAALFVREEIDFYVFLLLTIDDMIELDIDEADRPILMNAIHSYTKLIGNSDKML